MRRSNTLSTALYSCLTLTLCLSLTGCWESGPTQEEIDKARVDAANKRAAEAQAKREANADENGLVATSDPRVFKATKVLPKPASSANAVKPEYPALGYEHSYEGAEAVALYFQDLVFSSINNGDSAALTEICLPSSKYCNGVIEGINKNEAEGNWHEGFASKDARIVKWGVPPESLEGGEYSFIIEATVSDFKYFDKPKMTLEHVSGYHSETFVNLAFIDGNWKVVAGGSEKK